jgi:Na+/melibiose symporter-like transporter
MEPAAGSLASGGALAGQTGTAAQPRRTLGQLIAISVFWFAINFHWSALLLLLIPAQVYGLLFHAAPAGTLAARAAWVDSHKGLTLAVVMAPGLIVALIANPLFGLLSDRTPSRFGRRRPYILGGTLLNVAGLALMALGPLVATAEGSGNALAPSLLILMLALMLTQAANNAAAAPFHALLPDMVAEEQRGTASGIMGMALFLGQIGGAVVPALIGFNSSALATGGQTIGDFDTRIALGYGSVAVVITLMAILTALTVHEEPWTRERIAAQALPGEVQTGRALLWTVLAVIVVVAVPLALTQTGIGLTLDTNTLGVIQLLAVVVAGVGAAWAFDFRPRRNPDFSWVVLTRMLVMMGVYMVQNFLQYYMQDVAKSSNPTFDTTIFIVILTVTALVASLAAGPASDRYGRKRMVYVSGAFMAAVGAAFVLAPYLFPGHVLPITLGAGAIFGLGYGAYVSVDWALVADTLPSDATYARDMGVWNIGLTIPQVLAAIFGGALLALGASIGEKQLGYTFLFVWFVIFCVAGTVTVRFIKGVKR